MLWDDGHVLADIMWSLNMGYMKEMKKNVFRSIGNFIFVDLEHQSQ